MISRKPFEEHVGFRMLIMSERSTFARVPETIQDDRLRALG